MLGADVAGMGLLSQDLVVGEGPPDHRDDGPLRFDVGIGDEIRDVLAPHLGAFMEVAGDDLPARAGRLLGDAQFRRVQRGNHGIRRSSGPIDSPDIVRETSSRRRRAVPGHPGQSGGSGLAGRRDRDTISGRSGSQTHTRQPSPSMVPLIATEVFRAVVNGMILAILFGAIGSCVWTTCRLLRGHPILPQARLVERRVPPWGVGTILLILVAYILLSHEAFEGYARATGANPAGDESKPRSASPRRWPARPVRARRTRSPRSGLRLEPDVLRPEIVRASTPARRRTTRLRRPHMGFRRWS